MNRPRGFQSLLDAVDLPADIRADLLRRMAAPWRGYHGLQHLTVLWARHLRFGRTGPMRRPQVARLIAAAILFHDAILVPGAEDNEARSAELWAGRRGGCAASPRPRSPGSPAPSGPPPTT